MSRRRYPGDGEHQPEIKLPRRQLQYLVFWRSLDQPEKGTIWVWCSEELQSWAGLRSDEEIPLRAMCYRPSLLEARGVKWTATWADGTSHRFKASPQATKAVMARLAQRWKVPPVSLQRGNARAFDLLSLIEESHSHVYLVRLLTFEQNADGRAYYKIGKAVSIPRRIKQFGPCEVVAEARLPSEAESLKVEALLHQQFSAWRKAETEIFCLGVSEVEAVTAAIEQLSGFGDEREQN